jgi:hypothetical protein
MSVYDEAVVRKQIVVPPEIDARVRQLARQLGISQSAVIARAVLAMPEPQPQLARMLSFAGAIPDGASQLSEQVDDVLYG